MEIYTIGFTRRTASEFFEALATAGVRRLIDVRLRPSSQLAGFAKREHLAYLLERLVGAEYCVEPMLAPTPEMLAQYRSPAGTWDEYERGFLDLMTERKVERHLDVASLSGPTVLLCSEHRAEHCHRRLVVDHLTAQWGDVVAVHL